MRRQKLGRTVGGKPTYGAAGSLARLSYNTPFYMGGVGNWDPSLPRGIDFFSRFRLVPFNRFKIYVSGAVAIESNNSNSDHPPLLIR